MINVVMVTKDRLRLMEQAVRTLKENTSSPFNLTVIDDGSEIPISAGALSMVGIEHATVLRVTSFNSKGILGMVKNLGVYWAEKYWGRGDWLYMSDNDVYFTPGWDEKMTSLLRAVQAPTGDLLKVLAGSTHPFHGANPWPPGSASTPLVTLHDAVSGYSHLMRWKTWDKYGPLDANAVGVRQSEDWAFCQRIIKDGGVVGSIDPPVVYDCGLTDTFGEKGPGSDQIIRYEGVIQE